MAVTDEQRALLQLLLEGGQGYDDIGSLLGIGAEAVRTRARSALTEIGGADPDAQVGLSDYLLGQADPIGRADAIRHLQADPDANALAQRLVQHLRLLAPKAELPEIPSAKGGRRAAAVPPPSAPPAAGAAPAAPAAPPASQSAAAAPPSPGFASRAAGALSGLGKLEGKRRTQAIVGAAAALAIVIVLLVVVTGGGGGGGGSDCKSVDTAAAQRAGVATVPLTPIGVAAQADCKPTGQVALIPIPNQSQKGKSNQGALAGFALQTNAANVPAAAEGGAYVVWFLGSGDQGRPLGTIAPQDGNLNGAAPLSTTQLAVYLQALPTIRVSRVTATQSQQIQQALQANAKSKRPTGVVQFVGTPTLEGSGSDLFQQVQQQAQSQAGTSAGASGSSG